MKVIQTREVPAAITQLRAEIEALPINGNGRRRGIPDDLKRRAIEALIASQMRTSTFAKAVSVSIAAISKWKRQFRPEKKAGREIVKASRAVSGFKKISVMEETDISERFTIEGPGGIRITGLNASGVALLWRSLC